MSKIKPQDHPDYVGGWVWTNLELDWINKRIGTLEAALFQAQEAAKDLEEKLTKTEGWLNEAIWSYGELKREQLANSEKNKARWYQEGVEAEREACAKVCFGFEGADPLGVSLDCAEAIRARGNT